MAKNQLHILLDRPDAGYVGGEPISGRVELECSSALECKLELDLVCELSETRAMN